MNGIRPTVAALVVDPALAQDLVQVAGAMGARLTVVGTPGALWDEIERWPDLVLIEMNAAPDWAALVRRAKNLPHSRAIPIVAFAGRLEPGVEEAARAAGCDQAWTPDRLRVELPDLIRRTLDPPTRWLDGWDEPAPPALIKGVEQFNAGEYWECHETLEELWLVEPRPIRDLYQGILQIGVAFHHLRGRNYAGAVKMLRRGLPRLRGLPATCQGVDVAGLAHAARRVHDQVVALGMERIEEFDLKALPQIRYLAEAGRRV